MQDHCPNYGCLSIKQSAKHCTVMIRKNLLNCNLIRIKSSTKDLFDSCMASFNIHSEECPLCHRRGDCHVHCYYDRFVVDFIGGRPVFHNLKVLRVICACCGHTHAILPAPVIPYGTYSLFFILRVLAEYFMRVRSVASLCDTFCISPPQLYRWVKLYQEHRREWQGLLKSITQDSLKSIKELVCISPFSSFADTFLQKTTMSFMQSHRNPTHLRRNSSSP